MPGMTMHLDEFTLLRYTARDLSGEELGAATSHLDECPQCDAVLAQIRRLDRKLRALASAGAFEDPESAEFAPGDPFRARPSGLGAKGKLAGVGIGAVEASERGLALQEEVLSAIREPQDLAALLSRLSAARADHRFALFYALQETGRRSAESPFDAMTLGQLTLQWLRGQAQAVDLSDAEAAERMVPAVILRGQARLLLGIACLWTKEFSKAQRHLVVAYRSFGRGGADATSLAIVELVESQRRSFAGDGGSALALARRCRETYEAMGLTESAARAMVAEGLAFHALDRQEDAVASYRQALPYFEKFGLWSNYVGALNSAATSLILLGRVDEARREFARALRRFSHEQHKYWQGYIRIGLAEALFAAGHYSEAAVSSARAVRVFSECALRAHALIAMLLEIECLARAGSRDRARGRLELFWTDVARDGRLDPVVVQQLTDALSGADPGYEKLATLRRHVSDLIQQRYRAS